jgi:hypothetical protein
MLIRIVLYSLAALLMGAHFLRTGNWALVMICLSAPFAFLYRRRLSLMLLQALAYGAAATWLHTAWQLVRTRQSLEQNWTLAAAILGAVALVSLLAGLALNSRVMRERYVK